MHICISKLTIIGSDNGLFPGWWQAIIWTNAGILLTGPLEPNFSEILNRNSYIFIQENAFENIIWKMTAILSRSQCVNISQPEQNGWNFADYIFESIFMNENYCILSEMSLKLVLKGPVTDKLVLSFRWWVGAAQFV